MSTKKKLGISDLLRDEVQKGTDLTITVPAQNITENIAQNITENITENIKVKAETNTAVTSQPEIITLEASVIEAETNLEASLIQAQKRETELLQAIADLQRDAKINQTNLEILQKSLAAVEDERNQLDRQLVEVKRDNLRLAEANIQLLQQIKAAESATVPVNSQSSELVSQPHNNRATPRKQPVEPTYPRRSPYARPTGSNEQLQRVNNKNIGWMD